MNYKNKLSLIIVIFTITLLFGCVQSVTDLASVVGTWRIISETVYWNNGLSQSITPVTTQLKINSGGSWSFGSSSGTWTTSAITAQDWTDWGIAEYASATNKLTLANWNNDTSKGPIDETNGVIDNIWIIYNTTSQTNGDGVIWMKLSRVQ